MNRLLPDIKRWHVSYGFILVSAFVLLFDTEHFIIYSIAASSIHEAGHLAAIAWFDGYISDVYFRSYGVEMHLADSCSFSPIREIVVRLCGPLAGLCAAVIFSKLAVLSGDNGFSCLAGTNMVLSVINLIPACETDGGLALYYAVSMWRGQRCAAKTLNILTHIFGAAIILCGTVVLLLTKSNITLIIIGVYVLLSAGRKKFAPENT